MSGQNTPPQPPVVLGPPQRKWGTRRLGSRPYYILGAGAAGFVAIAGYAIHVSNQTKPAAQAAMSQAAGGANPNVVLAGLTGTGAIPAKSKKDHPASAPPPHDNGHGSTPPPDAPSGNGPPSVDEVRQAALKDAWTKYYQDHAQLQDKRRDEARIALVADTASAAPVDNRQQQGPQGGPGQVGEANAPTSQSQRQAALPGSLYQGPSHAADDYLQATVTPPLTRYELKVGDPIQVRFVQGVTSDAPGSFRAVVSQPVFDHATGLHILIPQGASVVGSYNQTQEIGSERLPAGATRIIYPGDSADSLDLGSMPLADQAGYAGLHDQVDHHYPRLIFNTLLLGLGGAGAQLTQPRGSSFGGYSASQILAAQLGQQFGQVGALYAQQQLNAKPTHTIRPGYTGTLQLTQDIAFPGEWIDGQGFVYARAGR